MLTIKLVGMEGEATAADEHHGPSRKGANY